MPDYEISGHDAENERTTRRSSLRQQSFSFLVIVLVLGIDWGVAAIVPIATSDVMATGDRRRYLVVGVIFAVLRVVAFRSGLAARTHSALAKRWRVAHNARRFQTMPTYEYACPKCGHQFEAFQSMRDEPLTQCPKCKKKGVKRLLGTGAGLIFKGSGFYITDYKKKSGGKSEGGGGGGESKSSSDSKPASDSKGSSSKPKSDSK